MRFRSATRRLYVPPKTKSSRTTIPRMTQSTTTSSSYQGDVLPTGRSISCDRFVVGLFHLVGHHRPVEHVRALTSGRAECPCLGRVSKQDGDGFGQGERVSRRDEQRVEPTSRDRCIPRDRR